MDYTKGRCSKRCTSLCAKAASIRMARTSGRDAARRVSTDELLSELNLPPPFHRLEHGDFVGVLDVAADRDAHRNPRHPQALAPQLLRQIRSGGLSLHRRISC